MEAAFSEWGYRAFLNLMALLGRPNLAGANMMVLKEAALKVGASPRWRRGRRPLGLEAQGPGPRALREGRPRPHLRPQAPGRVGAVPPEAG